MTTNKLTTLCYVSTLFSTSSNHAKGLPSITDASMFRQWRGIPLELYGRPLSKWNWGECKKVKVVSLCIILCLTSFNKALWRKMMLVSVIVTLRTYHASHLIKGIRAPIFRDNMKWSRPWRQLDQSNVPVFWLCLQISPLKTSRFIFHWWLGIVRFNYVRLGSLLQNKL
jgi:hypothetical protein